MKNYILILLVISFFSGNAQNKTVFEYESFENQFFTYEPYQNPKTSKKDFDYASMILRETKSAINNKLENFSVADYFNILSAFLSLKESKENIFIVYQKFKENEESCEYIIRLEETIKKSPKYDIIRKDYNKELAKCKSNYTTEKEFNIFEYCKTNNLDLALVKQINQINTDDQRYRNKSSKELKIKQQKLDKENQEVINSLYNKYKKYIGKSLVGRKFESVMWAVIQHSNVEMMAKYLPIIQNAVKEKELDVAPLKMLIDRFYGLKYGYQIFGSQIEFGFELADEKKRKEIKSKYGIE